MSHSVIHSVGLSRPFIPSGLGIEGSCGSWVYAYAVFASTDKAREYKDFCGGQSFWEGQQALQYDAAGNRTTGPEGRTIAYDGANRPVQVAWRSQTTDYL